MNLSKAFDTINYTFSVKLNVYGFSKETPKLIFANWRTEHKELRSIKHLAHGEKYYVV